MEKEGTLSKLGNKIMWISLERAFKAWGTAEIKS